MVGVFPEYNPKIISDGLNSCFIRYQQVLAVQNLNKMNNYTNAIRKAACSMVVFDADALEVANNINRMKKSGDQVDIPVKFPNFCYNFTYEWISRIFNLSLQTAIFPNSLKKIMVTPVYKKGLRVETFNHWPNSVLSNISKMFNEI